MGGRFYVKIKNSKKNNISLEGKTYGVMRVDKELGFTHAPNSYNTSRVTNNMGFLNINDVVSPENRNLEDVVFIAYGGSTTYCYNLEQKKAWPNIFQDKMCDAKKNNQLCKFSVFNGGHVMYSIGHIYKRAKRDIPIVKPNYLIIYSGINEYANYQQLKRQKKIDVDQLIKNKEYGLIAKYDFWYIKNNSIIVKLFYYKIIEPLKTLVRDLRKNSEDKNFQIKKKVVSSLGKNAPIIYENYFGVLKQLINLAAKHNTKVIFLVQSQDTDNKKNDIFATYMSQKAKDKVSELGAIVIDTREILDEYNGNKKELFHYTGFHYSVKGSNLVANLLLNKLKEKKILSFN